MLIPPDPKRSAVYEAGQGRVRQGKARRMGRPAAQPKGNKAVKGRQGRARQGTARQGKAKQGKAESGKLSLCCRAWARAPKSLGWLSAALDLSRRVWFLRFRVA